jgi:hypothetical protein
VARCRNTSAEHFLGESASPKVWKPKRTRRRLVLGMDVGLEESCTLVMCVLVGRFAYRSRCTTTIEDWVQRVWEPLVGYIPEVLMLLGAGWVLFLRRQKIVNLC